MPTTYLNFHAPINQFTCQNLLTAITQKLAEGVRVRLRIIEAVWGGMHRVLLILVACAVPTLAAASGIEKQTFGPLTIERWITAKGDPVNLPPVTPYWRLKHTFDAHTLTITAEDYRFTNASNFGLAALPRPKNPADITDLVPRLSRLPPDCGQKEQLTELQQRAIDRLHEMATKLDNGAVVWLYDYSALANDYILQSPYPSAFSQATNVQGLLFAYCKTADRKHLDLAVKGGLGMLTPIKDGGTLNIDGAYWFEECVAPPGFTPFILNGHLYVVNVLYQLLRVSGDGRFNEAANRGAKSFDNLLYLFDTGYWTRYDLRPRAMHIYLELHHAPETIIHKIEMTAPEGGIFTICESGCDRSFSDARNAFSLRFTAQFPSLVEWNPEERSIETRVRFDGPAPRLYGGGLRNDFQEIWEAPLRVEANTAVGRVALGAMAWSTTNDNYIAWHAFLAAELFKHTGNPTHFTTAVRWRNYLRVALNERKIETPRLKPIRFEPLADEAADRQIAACFAGADPLDVDLSAAAKLPSCVSASMLPDLLTRMGLMVRNGIASDGSAHGWWLPH